MFKIKSVLISVILILINVRLNCVALVILSGSSKIDIWNAVRSRHNWIQHTEYTTQLVISNFDLCSNLVYLKFNFNYSFNYEIEMKLEMMRTP